MFGGGEEFDYFCCGDCGCLQIERVPEDLARYYPPNYYSFHLQPVPQRGLKSWLAAKRDFSAATGRGVLGRLLNKSKRARDEILALGGIPARKEMRILDVGCGRGDVLSILYRAGVGHLEGVDPYLSGDVEVLPGLRVCKRALQEVSGEFDIIMLHHAFEHVQFGLELLAAARQRLSGEGQILLRLPTAESAAWERYRQNWVQLDAPRHLFLHTRKSLGILAEQAGLGVERSWCDSSAFQFWASELYEQGLSLYDQSGSSRDPKNYFSKAQMRAFVRQTKILNATDRGDQLAVILRARKTVSA
jgi:SAM-dependent methyltransferase